MRPTPAARAASSSDDAAGDVVAVVARRIADRLADERARGAVEDRLDPLALEQAGRSRRRRRTCRRRAERPVGDGRAMAGRQVVEDDDLVAGLDEALDRDRADIAGAAGHQDAHEDLRRGRATSSSSTATSGVDRRGRAPRTVRPAIGRARRGTVEPPVGPCGAAGAASAPGRRPGRGGRRRSDPAAASSGSGSPRIRNCSAIRWAR